MKADSLDGDKQQDDRNKIINEVQSLECNIANGFEYFMMLFWRITLHYPYIHFLMMVIAIQRPFEATCH
jgi:hypothetical protein